jgi:hypothetical protein
MQQQQQQPFLANTASFFFPASASSFSPPFLVSHLFYVFVLKNGDRRCADAFRVAPDKLGKRARDNICIKGMAKSKRCSE